MTLSSTTTRTSYTANGVQTVFAYPFRIDDDSHLQVYVDDALQASGYSMSGAGSDSGGNATFVAAPAADVNITLIRAVPLTQPTDLPTQGPLDTAAIETRLDQLVMIDQGTRELIARSLVLPPSAGALGLTLPALVASRVLATNPDGDALEWAVAVDGDIVSDAMVPVAGAATLPAARTALGLGGLGAITAADGGKLALISPAGAIVLAGPDGHFSSILNPDMAVDQVFQGEALTVVNGNDDVLVPCDGWKAQFIGAGAADISQVTASIPSSVYAGLVPVRAQKIDVTTADTSLAASDRHTVRLALDGHDCAWMRWGTAEAQTVTFSAFVKSSKTGIHEFFLRAPSSSLCYIAQATIDAAGTWQRVSFTVPGPTSGAFGAGTSTAFILGVNLGVGATFHASAANTWEAGAFMGTAGGPNLMDSPSNEFHHTGWQVDPGTVALPYRGVSFADNQSRCQRYLAVLADGTANRTWSVCVATSTSATAGVITLPRPMRATPTLTSTASNFNLTNNAGNTAVNAFTAELEMAVSGFIGIFPSVGSTPYTADLVVRLRAANASAKMIFNAANY